MRGNKRNSRAKKETKRARCNSDQQDKQKNQENHHYEYDSERGQDREEDEWKSQSRGPILLFVAVLIILTALFIFGTVYSQPFRYIVPLYCLSKNIMFNQLFQKALYKIDQRFTENPWENWMLYAFVGLVSTAILVLWTELVSKIHNIISTTLQRWTFNSFFNVKKMFNC
jgi:hypothetical protein